MNNIFFRILENFSNFCANFRVFLLAPAKIALVYPFKNVTTGKSQLFYVDSINNVVRIVREEGDITIEIPPGIATVPYLHNNFLVFTQSFLLSPKLLRGEDKGK